MKPPHRTPPNQRRARQQFSLIEVMFALALLMAMGAGVFAGIRMNQTMQRHYVHEQAALQVLDNTLERIAAESAPALERVERILAEEYSASSLAEVSRFSACCELRNSEVTLAVVDRNGRTLAEVRIPGDEKP